MLQVLQSLKTGVTEIAQVPVPAVARGHLLIETSRTLVSTGTERMLMEFGKAGWIQKARQQPDKVRMVLDKIRTDGLLPTLEAVMNKLDQPLPLGYCNVGRVVAVGAGVTGFEVGDRVASNGKHAEVVSVPVNLCARVPEGVSDEEAAFTVLGAIALQGIRLAQPTLGEAVVVTGLGLVGLLAVQLLRAHGCRVLGLDFDPDKLTLARRLGAEVVDLARGEDPLKAAEAWSRGRGVDAVLITASTSSSQPVHEAALMCRKRGRIVLVGVTGLELSRDDFFKKELTFQVSASYGPGRYDSNYEEKGQDYPVGFVRWTEQRNFEAVLDMMAERRIDVSALVSHRFPIAQAHEAYALIDGAGPALGILLEYAGPAAQAGDPAARSVDLPRAGGQRAAGTGRPGVSFIGAGNYATSTLIPAMRDAGADLRIVASHAGVTGLHAGRKFGFAQTTTDIGQVLADPATQAVVVSTRHDSHASLVLQALQAGKHVFVEKPLCLTAQEADRIEAALGSGVGQPMLMVGFNRRFAPQVLRMRELLAQVPGPKSMVMTVNAGAIAADHWTQDPEVGGGRLIGEACHFIDLLRHLAGVPITGWQRLVMKAATPDTATLGLTFADGSIGTVHYFANGNKAFPKERLQVFAGGRILQLDNFRRLQGHGWPGLGRSSLWRQDKGQKACAKAFLDAVQQAGASPIAPEELLEVARVAIALSQ